MPRTHAPTLAAILGVGLVLAVTRTPGAEPRAEVVARALPASGEERTQVAHRVVDMLQGPDLEDISMEVDRGGAVAGGAVEAAILPVASAILIEAPEVLAGFEIPVDRMGLLPGTHALSRAPLAFAEVGGRAGLVALVASWCAPCAAELPQLLAFAQAEDLRLVLVSLDDVAGPESLAAVIEDLFARAEPSSRAVPRVELRADPDAVWTDATAPLLIDRGDPGALPQTLLLSGDGKLLALVQGGFAADVAERLALHADVSRPIEGCR